MDFVDYIDSMDYAETVDKNPSIMEVSCGMLGGIMGVYRRMDGGWVVVGYWLLVVGCLLVI